MAVLVKNKKASFDYEIREKFESGIELLGLEVKSLRKKQGRLEGAHVVVRGGEVYLIGANIPPYQPVNTPKTYDSGRSRRLLLNKKEISALVGKEKEGGQTIIPLAFYEKGRKIKLEIAVVRGKKKYDKRESIKKREDNRRIEREIKRK